MIHLEDIFLFSSINDAFAKVQELFSNGDYLKCYVIFKLLSERMPDFVDVIIYVHQ